MIFIVEDEPPLRRSMVAFFDSIEGTNVAGFGSAEEALAAAEESPPDVAICDVQLPGMSGLELVEQLAAIDPGIVRIIMTAHSSVQSAVRAMRSGCYEYLEKPVDLEQLERLVERSLSERRSGRELMWLRGVPEDDPKSRILGASDAILQLKSQIDTLSELKQNVPPVLITGETGVGKGLVARVIHDARLGTDRPWIEINCAALPATLIEAELFGYERSAFTDAKQAKPGLFEAAANGTVFLDEIGELPLPIQSKLLSVVESGRVRRLGAVHERSISAAIIAATNISPVQAVEEGTFRRDLYHRLAAFTIEIPPLRERTDDAVLLGRTFLARAAKRYRKSIAQMTPEAEGCLLRAPWPGNVRELMFTVERAVLLAGQDKAELSEQELIEAGVPGRGERIEKPASATSIAVTKEGISVEIPEEGVSYIELEKAILTAALRRTGNNVVQAARLLDLKRDAMRYRIQKLNLTER